MNTIASIGANRNFNSYLLKILRLKKMEFKLFTKCIVSEENYYDYVIINANNNIKDTRLKGGYCFINMDLIENVNAHISVHGNIITYGLGNKNTVTLSSIEDKSSFVYCLQRNVDYNALSILEPEEIPVNVNFENDDELYAAMVGITIIRLQEKCINNLNESKKITILN